MAQRGLVPTATLCLALMLATAAPADEATFAVDPVHTTVMFRIRHADVSWFYGRFDRAGGKFVLDADGNLKSLDVYVEAASINTNNAERDKVLRSEPFFDAKKHPKIRFVSRRIRPLGPDRWRVTGELTLRGVTRPVTVEIEKVGEAETRVPGGYRVGLHTVFSIRRTDFAMNALLNGLGDEVRLFVAIEGLRK